MSDSKAVFEAIQAGDRDRLAALLQQQPSLARSRNDAGVSAVLTAAYQGRGDLVELLVGAGPELDSFEAAALGDLDRLTALLGENPELVADWSADGFTALHLAAFFGREKALALLLERGADTRLASRNPMQVHPLHSAAASRSAALVERLLAHGCDVDAQQAGGFTALHSAAHHGDERMVRALLAHGARRGIPADDGKTAAEMARTAGFEDLARTIEAG